MSFLKLISGSCLMKFTFAVSSLAVFALIYWRTFDYPSSLQPRQRIHDPMLRNISYQSKSCSCPVASTNLRDYVNKDNFSAIVRRRATEYENYLSRKTSVLNQLLFAQANSPLRYPIQGFIVRPLQKSVIPGLGVHGVEKEIFLVTLSVSSGVLEVENLQEKGQVEGQGEKVLSISASSLESLNDLLGRVSYRSTVYSIKSGDLVNFTFEPYEGIFPIVIRQPAVPVLYDLGEDINSQVTVTTKTFLRYPEVNRLINSIRTFYKNIKIIVADDNFEQQKVNGDDIEQYFMPPAQGWFAGRNLAVSQVTTKYFLWVDDDFYFTEKTKIERFVEIMESKPELDVVAGSVGSNKFSYKLIYEEGDEEGGCLSRVKGTYHPVPGIPECYYASVVINFFLARTDAIRKVGFDPLLKRVAHSEFFMDGLGELLAAICPVLNIAHQHRVANSNYSKFRHPPRSDGSNKLYRHFFKNRLKCMKW